MIKIVVVVVIINTAIFSILPYAYAKAHTVLLEDDGARLTLWAPETVALPALSEVLRLYDLRDTAETRSAVEAITGIAATSGTARAPGRAGAGRRARGTG